MGQDSPEQAPDEAEYDAIAATLLSSARGRRFLAEVERRSRSQDLATILTAIETLASRTAPAGDDSDTLRAGVADLVGAIDRAAVQIAALECHERSGSTAAPAPLGERLREQHNAVSAVLDAAERIQEAAWTLREQGVDGAVCDFLDERATEIYAACNRQEAHGRVSAIAVAAYEFIVQRVADLCRTCAIRTSLSGGIPTAAAEPTPDWPLSLPGEPDEIAFEVPGLTDAPQAPSDGPAIPAGPRELVDAFSDRDGMTMRERLAILS